MITEDSGTLTPKPRLPQGAHVGRVRDHTADQPREGPCRSPRTGHGVGQGANVRPRPSPSASAALLALLAVRVRILRSATMAEQPNFNLDPASRKELEQFIETQQAQSRVQTQVHMLTSMCWDKCVFSPLLLPRLVPHRVVRMSASPRLASRGPPSRSASVPISAPSRCVGSISSGFSGKEQSCLANCVDRFLDTSVFLVKKVEDQRAASMGH
ncbi:hypothetical protein ONZ51_g2025 [Trametes cubensis]|uniref:Tim10-like domain-containing protein n=1 Tax=Trametes cubensis TaxID=1111947 RepID=A0AAD7U0X9_9APHY|nr:hypothetical protein ONZ51_g2025 [Trametes cubensis]